jgi:hypothetical protein
MIGPTEAALIVFIPLILFVFGVIGIFVWYKKKKC